MYIKCTENTLLTKQKNTLNNVTQEVVMDNCLQKYSKYYDKYEAQFRIVAANGFRREIENIILIYDKLMGKKKWIVKYWNSNDQKSKYKWYETKKEAQTFIRGRKRRIKKRVKKLENWLFEDLFFEFDETK